MCAWRKVKRGTGQVRSTGSLLGAHAISLVTSFLFAKCLTGIDVIAGGIAPGQRSQEVSTLTGSHSKLNSDPVRVNTLVARLPGALPPAINLGPVRALAVTKEVTKLMAHASRMLLFRPA